MNYVYAQKGKNMKNRLMMSFTALTVLLSTNVAFAHEDQFHNNACDIQLIQDVTITPDHILIRSNDKTLYDLYKNDMVFYKGEKIQLTPEQKDLVSQYVEDSRNLVPAVNRVVVDSIQVASDALSKTFDEFGIDNDIESKFNELQYTLQEQYRMADGTYHFTNDNLHADYANEKIDEAIEDVMADLVPSLIGNVLQLVGKAMTEGEDGFAHLEGMDERIEQEIEAQAERLEEQVEILCQDVKRLNELEDRIQKSSSEFNQFDVINYSDK